MASRDRIARYDEADEEELELILERELMESDHDSVSLASRDTDEDRSDEEDDDEEAPEITQEHYEAIRTTVIDILTALGGLEESTNEAGEVERIYAVGDECLRCLRDLRTLLHQDEQDVSRVVPIIFSEVNVVQRGLLPLLLKSTSMGEKGSKIALACTDLLTSLTWPIDIAAEQQAAFARDSDKSPLEALQKLQGILVSYKSAVLKLRSGETKAKQRSVLNTVMLHILLPALSKPRHKRNEREIGTISMCLHLFRNLLAIRDPNATSLSASETIALSNLQSDLLVEMQQAHILDTLLMLANNAESRDFEAWNVVTAECVYHIYAGASPEWLLSKKGPQKTFDVGTSIATTQQTSALSSCLAEEGRRESQAILNAGTSRHSRFSTTINFRDDNGALRLARSQRALRKSSDQLSMHLKEKSKRRFRRKRVLEEVGAAYQKTPWSPSASRVVSDWADKFLRMGLENLVRSVVKDIRSESAKAGDIAQTRTRLMRLSHFFLNYFLLSNEQERDLRSSTQAEQTTNENDDTTALQWGFGLVAYWLEPWALKMAWLRSSQARDDRAWLEFVTAVQLWSTLLRMIDAMSQSKLQVDRDLAEGIQASHFYDELALDAAKSVMKTYTNQSFRCLETIIDFSHIMPRTLERYSKDKENLFVKAKRQVRQSTKDGETMNAEQVQEEQEQVKKIVESQIKERKFEFEKFQGHLCTEQLANACLLYLARYEEITEGREAHLTSVLRVLHRMAVKAGSLRLFYRYERRMMIRKLRDDQVFWSYLRSHAPKVHDDMGKLFKYVSEKYDKLDDDEKARWAEGMKAPRPVKVFKMPAEIEIKSDVDAREHIAVAVSLMLAKDMLKAVVWVKGGLDEAIRAREHHAALAELDEDDDGNEREELTSVLLSYHGDGMIREWASKNPEMKLLCRLVGFVSEEDDDHDWKWSVAASHAMQLLASASASIENALATPFQSLDGEPVASLVQRKRKEGEGRKRMTKVVNEYGDEEDVYVPRRRPRIVANPKERSFIDQDIIEDSDEEIEAAERILAERRALSMANGERSGGDIASDRETSDDDDVPSQASPRAKGSSERLSRSSSVTSSSVHDVASPKGLAKRKRLTRPTKASLFLGSDADDSDTGDEADDESVHQSPTSATLKRTLYEADIDVISPSVESYITSPAQTQPRKRRAVIVDDEDEDE